MRPSMQLDLPSSRISSHLTRTLPHHRDCDNTIYEAHGTTHVAPVHGPSTEDRLWASMSITMTASSPESVATCVSEDKSRKRTALADADCRDDLRKRQRVANRLAQSCPGMLTVERKLLPCKADNGFNVIDAATVQSLVSGEFGNDLHYFLLDCRFPYEYEGGHIMGALNIPLPSDIHSFFKGPLEMNSRTIFIFHCEFSSERAPEVCRAFRTIDRELNKDNWPDLYYPELYVLKGGYKEFWNRYPECCYPLNYVKMSDDEEACKKFFMLRKACADFTLVPEKPVLLSPFKQQRPWAEKSRSSSPRVRLSSKQLFHRLEDQTDDPSTI